ncbi:Protein FAM71A [Heterocephalus glaber]|uniref:Protein FAM71A n=1 Tax=Heterocephalus glaber TaxID=10181 RepID=G5C7N2_HETGA|nr:Protein FAM71A [Heterocephalus glaber]
MVTNSESPLPCYTAKSGSAASISGTSMGKLKRQLQWQLRKGEYYMFRSAPIFESDFIQITKRGKLTDVHNHGHSVTERLIYLPRLPFESNSGTYATPAEDILCLPALADSDSSSLATSDAHGRDDWDQVSTRNIYVVAELTGATSAAHASGEGDQPSSRTSTATPKVCTPETRSVGSAEASAPGEGGSKSTVAGPGGAEARQQGTPQASKASLKEHRERKERRDRPLSRSSYHRRTREGRHRTERDKMAQKSSSQSLSGHRTHRVNKNEEGGHLRAKSSKHGHSPKGISHSPLEKESRSWNKSGRSLSAMSSESTPKRLSWLSSFLRNIRANLGMKGAASLHGGNVDTVPKRVEETDLEAMVEMAECGQGIEVGSVTSEVLKTMTLRSP